MVGVGVTDGSWNLGAWVACNAWIVAKLNTPLYTLINPISAVWTSVPAERLNNLNWLNPPPAPLIALYVNVVGEADVGVAVYKLPVVVALSQVAQSICHVVSIGPLFKLTVKLG